MIIAFNKLIHISKDEIQDMDITMAKVMVLLLKKYISERKAYYNYNKSIPDSDVSLEIQGKSDIEKWHWILNEMLWAFSYISGEKLTSPSHKAATKRKKRGLELFAKYISSLWI